MFGLLASLHLLSLKLHYGGSMLTDLFDFSLPSELIAQSPTPGRDQSKLMVLHRDTQTIDHCVFSDIVDFFHPGDMLVLNNTRVFNARLRFKKSTGAAIELFLVEDLGDDVWKCLAKPAKRLKEGDVFHLSESFSGTVLTRDSFVYVRFSYAGNFFDCLDALGEPPLPPYIHVPDSQVFKDRYQTVFASEIGSVAAPTAGLHFTPALLDKLQAKGVKINYITLHVGYGTFKPVTAHTVQEHIMHEEVFSISSKTAMSLSEQKKSGLRLGAVGTTSARTLESAISGTSFISGQQASSLFIYPGYRFKCLDFMVTNFHLPRSSLLMLVSAFADLSFVKHAYTEAVKHRYRFYSFGDAMLVL